MRQLREQAGWTLMELESRSGISRADLSHIERGLRVASPAQRARLSRAFGVELETRTMLVHESDAA